MREIVEHRRSVWDGDHPETGALGRERSGTGIFQSHGLKAAKPEVRQYKPV